LSWERAVEKFNWLSEPFADAELRHNIIEAVMKIDERPIADLMNLLGKVNPKAVHPAFHPGIQ
jgi:2-methylcitrate dehydratase